MKLLFIGDIVGKKGRTLVKYHLPKLRKTYGIDRVVANYENASHGFGLTPKNYTELKNAGVDIFTGGNHTFDKKEIEPLLETEPVLRPLNFFQAPGRGIYTTHVGDTTLGVINAMGIFTMPYGKNPFIEIKESVEKMKSEGVETIFVDFHAESTSEKRALYLMLQEKISGLIGTHTHIGTDDLIIEKGAMYLTDVGMTGCRDGVIGVEKEAPIKRFTTGRNFHFLLDDSCKGVFQAVIMEFERGECIDAFKVKAYDREETFVSQQAKREGV